MMKRMILFALLIATLVATLPASAFAVVYVDSGVWYNKVQNNSAKK